MHLSALKDFTDYFFSGLPDLQHPLDELITEGDKVALRGRYAGTHTGGATAERARTVPVPVVPTWPGDIRHTGVLTRSVPVS